jgi:hypothetical protein
MRFRPSDFQNHSKFPWEFLSQFSSRVKLCPMVSRIIPMRCCELLKSTWQWNPSGHVSSESFSARAVAFSHSTPRFHHHLNMTSQQLFQPLSTTCRVSATDHKASDKLTSRKIGDKSAAILDQAWFFVNPFSFVDHNNLQIRDKRLIRNGPARNDGVCPNFFFRRWPRRTCWPTFMIDQLAPTGLSYVSEALNRLLRVSID